MAGLSYYFFVRATIFKRSHRIGAPERGWPSSVRRRIANPVRESARGFKSPSPRARSSRDVEPDDLPGEAATGLAVAVHPVEDQGLRNRGLPPRVDQRDARGVRGIVDA